MGLQGDDTQMAAGIPGVRPLVLPGEPAIAYQPVVDLGSGMLLGFEALVRWRHPTEGIILPALLIPWAEANGDIVALGEFVLREGCRHAAKWPRSLQLAVNVSIVQLRRGVASTAVAHALEGSGLPPDRLTVEVTEHALNDEQALNDLRRIAAMEVQLAVDDVGTSWNSFDRLRRMAVNTIKIDGSFVAGLEVHEGINRMIVETVVHLAHSSGMSTVAEGVETATHAAIVREFDSDAAQGYFFAPPLPPEQASALAAKTEFRFPLDGPGWVSGDGLGPSATGPQPVTAGQKVTAAARKEGEEGDGDVEDVPDMDDMEAGGSPSVTADAAGPGAGSGAADPTDRAGGVPGRPRAGTGTGPTNGRRTQGQSGPGSKGAARGPGPTSRRGRR